MGVELAPFTGEDVVAEWHTQSERYETPGAVVTELLRVRGRYRVAQSWIAWDCTAIERLYLSDLVIERQAAERLAGVRVAMARGGLL